MKRSSDLMTKKPKILLAEDEPSMRRYIQTLMGPWDCDLAVEQTGSDAISRAATFRPDTALIGFVTDPGMDGAQSGISLLRVSPETQIVLWNEPVPTHVLSDLRAWDTTFGRFPRQLMNRNCGTCASHHTFQAWNE